MNNLQIFNNPEFGDIRTVKIDGEPWFVGKDIAEALGYTKARNVLASHVDIEDKKGGLNSGRPWWTTENDHHQRVRSLQLNSFQ